jgi:hypothetical protein
VRRQTENGVDDMIRLFQCGGKVVCERNIKVFELGRETLGLSAWNTMR